MLFKMYIEPNLVPRAFPHVVPSPPTTKKKAQRTKLHWDQPRSQGFPYVVPEFILKKEKKTWRKQSSSDKKVSNHEMTGYLNLLDDLIQVTNTIPDGAAVPLFKLL